MEALIQSFKITDITASIEISIKQRKENITLLSFSADGIKPYYASKISATYMLMEWPLIASSSDMIRCYAFLLPHGKIHVVEVFFMKQSKTDSFIGEYLGTTKVFSISLPNNTYESKMDEAIAEAIWLEVGGHAF